MYVRLCGVVHMVLGDEVSSWSGTQQVDEAGQSVNPSDPFVCYANKISFKKKNTHEF